MACNLEKWEESSWLVGFHSRCIDLDSITKVTKNKTPCRKSLMNIPKTPTMITKYSKDKCKSNKQNVRGIDGNKNAHESQMRIEEKGSSKNNLETCIRETTYQTELPIQIPNWSKLSIISQSLRSKNQTCNTHKL